MAFPSTPAKATNLVRKFRRFLGPLLLSAAASISVGPSLHAATQTWLGDGGSGGDGTWSTNADWSPNKWVAGDVALFGGTAGTVTVGTETAGGLTFNVGGYTLASGTLTLNTGSFIATTSGTTTFASTLNLAGAAGVALTKTGSGILALSTSNGSLGTAASPAVWTITGGTYSSSTGIFDSVLSIGAGNNLGTVATSGTTATQVILDAGTLLISGTGLAPAIGSGRTIQVNAAGGAIVDSTGNPFYGNVVNNAGSNSSLYLSNTSGTTTFTKDPNASVGGVISGGGSLTWNGAGTLALGGTNTYSGGTVVNSGTLSISSDANLGADSGTVTLAGGTLSNTANLNGSAASVLEHNIATGTIGGTINVPTGLVLGLNYFNNDTYGDITGSGPLTKTGAGQLIVSGNNSSYAGNWTVNGGILEVQYNGSTSLGSGSVTLAAGTEMSVNYAKTISNAITSSGGTISYAVGGGGVYSGAISLTSGTTTTVGLRDFYSTSNAESGSITGVISGGGGLSLSGGGELTLNPGNNGGTTGNSFTGGITLGTGSTLGIYAGTALGSAPSVATTQLTFAGNSTLQFLVSPTATLYSTRNFSIGSGVTATIDTQSYNAGIAGVILGSGSLTKIGSGTLTLTGTNTYSGGTTLTAGTLAINTDASLGTGTLTLNGGTLASVQTAGITMTRTIATGTTGGTIQLNNATAASGNNKISLNTTGQITGSGPITVTNNGVLSIGAANTGYSGNWTLNGGVVELTNNNSAGSGSFTINTGAELSTLGGQITNAISLNGGRIGWDYYSGTGDYQGPVTLLSGGGTVSLVNFYAAVNGGSNTINGTISGNISGAGGLTVSDVDPGGYYSINGTLTLSGNNSYTGGTTIGLNTTVQLGSTTALGATSNPLSVAGFLALNGYSPTVGALTMTGTNTTAPISTATAGTPGLRDARLHVRSEFGRDALGCLRHVERHQRPVVQPVGSDARQRHLHPGHLQKWHARRIMGVRGRGKYDGGGQFPHCLQRQRQRLQPEQLLPADARQHGGFRAGDCLDGRAEQGHHHPSLRLVNHGGDERADPVQRRRLSFAALPGPRRRRPLYPELRRQQHEPDRHQSERGEHPDQRQPVGQRGSPRLDDLADARQPQHDRRRVGCQRRLLAQAGQRREPELYHRQHRRQRCV